jgi:hypothetical protein
MSPRHESSDKQLRAVTRDQEFYDELIFQAEEVNAKLDRVLGFLDRLDVPTKAKA